MKTTVRDLIETFDFNDFEIIAGHNGINREVKSVTVMDAPDIYNWIKGGEFLITSGYCMKDDPMQMEFLIRKLHEAGASCLGIKLNRFIDKLPQNVVKTAEELSFPVLFIPIEYAFVDIINPVLSNIVNNQARKLRHSENIHKSFTQLVINGGNTQQIIEILAKILEKDIIYYDEFFNKIYSCIVNDCFLKELQDYTLDKMLIKYNFYSIIIDKKIYGYIIVGENKAQEKFNEYDEIALEHASTILKLDVQKKISNIQIETRYRDEFVQDLIMNNVKSIEEIKNRANIYGWNFNNGLRAIIVDIDNYKVEYLKMKYKKYNTIEDIRKKIFNTIIRSMKENFKQIVYTTFSDSIVFLVEDIYIDKKKSKDKYKKIGTCIKNDILKINNFSVTVAIGNYKSNLLNINESYNEAQRTIKIGRMIYNGNRVVFYDELGVYRLFSSICATDEAKSFYIPKLRKLIYHDKKYNSDLLNTLECLIKNDWNLKYTSKEMFVHYNTIKYRFKKITDILDMDLQNSEQKLDIMIAMKLFKMTQ